MTKTNAYATAIDANAETVKERNKQKAATLKLLVNDKACLDMLKKNNVDAKRFAERALYATEKCVKIVHAVTREHISVADLNANAFATIKSAILAKRANKMLTKRDIECSLSKDQKFDASRADVIFQRNALLSASTLAAQSQQCVDMIKTLNIAKEVARNTFEIQDCVLMQQFEEKFADIAI